MRIYLIRHGEKQLNKVLNSEGFPDMALTSKGVLEAQLTGRFLSNIEIDAIYSSDLIRAYQTAEYISDSQDNTLTITVDKRIREIDMGQLYTSSEKEVKEKYPEFYRKYEERTEDFHYPDGESGVEFCNRTVDFIESLPTEQFENVCVVCHGGVIRSVISHYLELPVYKRFNIHPDNCGISILDKNSNGTRVVSVNETSHLNTLKA